MSDREVVILSGVRTAIGSFGGSLKDLPPSELAAQLVRAAVARAEISPEEVGHVVFGHVINTDPHDMYLARFAAVRGGLPIETPAFNVNRLCGSGLQAIVSAAQIIKLGDADAAVAGGAECMSRGPYAVPAMRWGARMNDAKMVDMMIGALSDPFEDCHMGITGENVAARYSVSRADQDALALLSHQRAAHAIDQGYFTEQIVPIEIPVKGGTAIFNTDENVRRDTSLERLAKLKPVFKKDGSVTAGNASGVNDGAAALVLMERKAAEQRGYRPLARLVGYGYAAVDPKYMGIGPVPAVQQVLKQTGIKVEELDVIELNEAFASQALAVARELDLPADRVNPNGSGISLGHPIGATGSIISVKAIHELQRIGGRYALVTMCIGGGQGIAAIYERL